MKCGKDGESEKLRPVANYANPDQTAVCTVDCPLYVLQKKCQWLYPEDVGERKLVVVMGMLHIEMCIQECGGKIFRRFRMGAYVSRSQDI